MQSIKQNEDKKIFFKLTARKLEEMKNGKK